MRILLLEPSSADVVHARRVLESAGHTVVGFADPKAAFPFLIDGHADVAVIDWSLGAANGLELVHRVRAAETDGYIFILMLTGKEVPVQIEAAFAAGIDDFVRKPLGHAELLARVAGAERLRKTTRLMIERDERKRTAVPPKCDSIVALKAWSNFSEIEQGSLADFTALSLEVAESADFHPTMAATIPYSLPSECAELRFFVEIDHPSLEVIGSAMLGDRPAEAALADLLLEMTNTVGGTFMRHAVEEEVPLTTGWPTVVAPSDVTSAVASAETRKTITMAFSDSGARIRVSAAIRTKQNVRVPVARLREGMVLVEDVHAPNGALFIRGGTRITATVCARLDELLGSTSIVEVVEVGLT